MFLPIIFLLWYYYSFYSEQQKQKIGKLLLISIVCIILSQVLLEFRRGDVDTGYDSDLFMMFFSQQGVSLLVFAYMIFYKSTFVNTGLPYILYPLSLTSTFEGQSMEFVEQTNSLGHRLTYFLAPDAYLGGEGVGSSFLGEFWDLGLIGFLLMSFLAGYIIRYFEKSVRNTRVIMFLAFILVPNIVYMPRASFFPS
ncbi:O-antigen polysaccharide polymerase Wzy [Bacteroides sp. D20]|uniref:O-antigen polysaccharide polymerase Wzy n=1 Tax=Bacteroides sp. D20 TaxID=585543 RepID=UPI000E5D927C|nr:O-antigen polysaccharide polymerase Wzy [Bacteroides sp. D20]